MSLASWTSSIYASAWMLFPWTDITRKVLRSFVWDCPCVSTPTNWYHTHDQICQAFPIRVCMLQVISCCRWKKPGNKAGSLVCWRLQTLQIIIHSHTVSNCKQSSTVYIWFPTDYPWLCGEPIADYKPVTGVYGCILCVRSSLLFICSPVVQLDGVGGADIGMQRPCIHRLPCRKHLAKMDMKWLSLYKLLTFLDSCPRCSLECKGEKVPPQAIYVRANSDVNQMGFGGLSLM